jgi:hypothetical protein
LGPGHRSGRERQGQGLQGEGPGEPQGAAQRASRGPGGEVGHEAKVRNEQGAQVDGESGGLIEQEVADQQETEQDREQAQVPLGA